MPASDSGFDCGMVLDLPLYKLDGVSIMSQDAYGRLATVTGALWTPQGRSFDGVDDRIALPVALDSYPAWCLELWVYLKAGLNGKGILGYSGNYSLYCNGSDALSLYWNAGTLTFSKVVRNSWNHVVIQRKGSSWTAFSNGLAENPATNVNTTADSTLYLGGQGNGDYGNTIQGEIRIYKRTLTPQEVQRNFLATKWRYL